MWLKKKSLKEARSIARGPSRLDLPLSCDQSLTTSTGGGGGKDVNYLGKLRRLLAKRHEADCKVLLHMGRKMAGMRSFRTEASN
jgi:hypothetical protein